MHVEKDIFLGREKVFGSRCGYKWYYQICLFNLIVKLSASPIRGLIEPPILEYK
jgi:hypothetical protein